MDYNSIVKNYSEEKKDMIISLANANKSDMALNNLYNDSALKTFFNLWREHFPNVSQEITCQGCRQAVTKFFHNVADFISSERLLAEEKTKEVKVKKSKRTKVKQ
jgi:hypothetical protein